MARTIPACVPALLDPPWHTQKRSTARRVADAGRQAADRGRGGLGDPRHHRRTSGTNCPRIPNSCGRFVPAGCWFPACCTWSESCPRGCFGTVPCVSLGQEVPLGRTLRAYYIGHLGKYVPGKAVVVVMRTGLDLRSGRRCEHRGGERFLETLTMMASGAFLGGRCAWSYTTCGTACSFWAAGGGAATGGTAVFGLLSAQGWWLLASLAMLVATGLPTLPPVFLAWPGSLGVGRSDPAVAAKLAQFRYRTLLWGWLMMFAGWAFIGASLWATLKAAGAPDIDLLGQLPLYTAATALALVAGFVLLLPSGAVVREAVLWSRCCCCFPAWGTTWPW